MILSQAYLWALGGVAGGAAFAAVVRYLTLFAGLKLTLRGAPSADRLPIFREFARALSLKPQPESAEQGSEEETSPKEPAETDLLVLRGEDEGTSRYGWLGRSRN
jgi:hypothetical protein